MLAHELNGIVNRVNLLRHIVSNLQGKLVFNRHNHLHHVQRVQLQVVDEVGVLRHLRQLDRENTAAYLVRVNGIEVLHHIQHTLRHLLHGQERLFHHIQYASVPEKRRL